MPDGTADGILKGLYRIAGSAGDHSDRPQLFGSGPILREALRAAELLGDYDIEVDVWSATSYLELSRDARAVDRWNRLHPEDPPRTSYLDGFAGRSDTDRSSQPVTICMPFPEQIRQWIPGRYATLGTDGFGRSRVA